MYVYMYIYMYIYICIYIFVQAINPKDHPQVNGQILALAFRQKSKMLHVRQEHAASLEDLGELPTYLPANLSTHLPTFLLTCLPCTLHPAP